MRYKPYLIAVLNCGEDISRSVANTLNRIASLTEDNDPGRVSTTRKKQPTTRQRKRKRKH